MAQKPNAQAAYHQLGQTLRGLEADLRWGLNESERIPAAWTAIAQGAIAPSKEKVTLWVDADVIQFLRSMGRGHLSRMNAVLRAFMLARLAEVVKAMPDYTPSVVDQAAPILNELAALIKAKMDAKSMQEASAHIADVMPILKTMRDEYREAQARK